MRVDGLHHHVHRGLGFHRRHRFGDQLEALGPDDVHAENLAVGLVGHHFDEAFVMSQDGRAAVAREGNLPILTLKPCGARLGLGKPDAADARLRVGAPGMRLRLIGCAGLPAMCATAIMPSRVATCASCGVPATTSPIA
jgi:hypothetical protein